MTNTNMEIFKNEEFGSVRIIEEDGKYLFCCLRCCKSARLQQCSSALQRHCNGVVKRDTVTSTRGVQTLTYIPEGDVYRLIVHSKLPSAERFRALGVRRGAAVPARQRYLHNRPACEAVRARPGLRPRRS